MKEEHEKQNGESWLSSLAEKAESILTKKNQCILFLLTLVLVAVAIFDAANDFFPEPVSITLYVLAAIGFVLTCTLWVKAILMFITSVILPFTKSNQLANTLITNNRLRIVLTTLPGMGVNLIYAVFNGVIGITGRSAWYGSLSAYYLLLCIMRFLAVSYARQVYTKKVRTDNMEIRELKVYQNCGGMLSIMSIALGGAVITLVMGDNGKTYPGLMIYAAATYTFYKLIVSIINMVKVRKEKSLLLTTLRNISYSDSLVSLLSLQTALFAAFGQNAGKLVPIMNTLTGAGVCLMVLGLGIYMIHDAKKRQATVKIGKETKE